MSPAVGDVVIGDRIGSAQTLGTVERGFLGRITSTWEINGSIVATIRLDDNTLVRSNVRNLTVVERYTGPASAIIRWSGGWKLDEVYDWRRGAWEIAS